MAEAGQALQRLQVTVAICTEAGAVREWCGEMPAGSQLADALRLAGCDATALDAVGVWGKAAPLTHVLRDSDRVEVYRPLRVDPKVARRERFVSQGARSAGLFAHKPGAKP